ncbi:unnamed protein product [Rotaria magnacalcarata]
MDGDSVIKKFKDIVSHLPVTKPLKQQLEALLNQYNEDDSNALPMLILETHDLLRKNNTNPTKSIKQTEASALIKSTSKTVNEMTNQQLLNEIFDNFEFFLQISALESRVSSLEDLENNGNIIKMGNIAAKLRNKLVRFIKPNLSYRAARDEYIALIQSEDRYQQLSSFIREHDANLSVSDLARQIKALLSVRVSKAHEEVPMSESEVDMVLYDYAAQCDEYTKQAASTVWTVFLTYLVITSLHISFEKQEILTVDYIDVVN